MSPNAITTLRFTNPLQLQNGIDAYRNGDKKDIDLSEKEYLEKYETHLKQLERWVEVDPVSTTRLRMKWYKKLMCVLRFKSAN